MLGRNFAHLQIRPRRDVAERPAQTLGEISHSRKLPMLHDAVRDPQPAHVGILRRRDVEQAVIAPAEIVGGRWRRIVERLLLQPRIGIERMLLALELLLIDKLLARRGDPILRLDVRSLRSAWLDIRLARIPAAEAATD